MTKMALLKSHFNIKYDCLLTSIFSVFLVGVHITTRFRQTQLLMWMSVGFDYWVFRVLFLLGEDLLQKLDTEKLLRTLATDHINYI